MLKLPDEVKAGIRVDVNEEQLRKALRFAGFTDPQIDAEIDRQIRMGIAQPEPEPVKETLKRPDEKQMKLLKSIYERDVKNFQRASLFQVVDETDDEKFPDEPNRISVRFADNFTRWDGSPPVTQWDDPATVRSVWKNPAIKDEMPDIVNVEIRTLMPERASREPQVWEFKNLDNRFTRGPSLDMELGDIGVDLDTNKRWIVKRIEVLPFSARRAGIRRYDWELQDVKPNWMSQFKIGAVRLETSADGKPWTVNELNQTEFGVEITQRGVKPVTQKQKRRETVIINGELYVVGEGGKFLTHERTGAIVPLKPGGLRAALGEPEPDTQINERFIASDESEV